MSTTKTKVHRAAEEERRRWPPRRPLQVDGPARDAAAAAHLTPRHRASSVGRAVPTVVAALLAGDPSRPCGPRSAPARSTHDRHHEQPTTTNQPTNHHQPPPTTPHHHHRRRRRRLPARQHSSDRLARPSCTTTSHFLPRDHRSLSAASPSRRSHVFCLSSSNPPPERRHRRPFDAQRMMLHRMPDSADHVRSAPVYSLVSHYTTYHHLLLLLPRLDRPDGNYRRPPGLQKASDRRPLV